jgi:hypothetical protein
MKFDLEHVGDERARIVARPTDRQNDLWPVASYGNYQSLAETVKVLPRDGMNARSASVIIGGL